MSQGRRVVAELSKVWESVVAKGKSREMRGVKVQDIKTWLSERGNFNLFQSATARMEEVRRRRQGQLVTEETRMKVGRIMAAYEDLIGIKEVKNAHEKVLKTEAKFIECQEQRRTASKQLTEVQNGLTEIRAELDKAQRGDEAYLELIKREIFAIKDERAMRKEFEEWERTEREVFSQLSNALRLSHEKERAQNEKTKYWSIMGSLIGATLGIIGATINNKMKQNTTKQVLEETSAQVAHILTTLDTLANQIMSQADQPQVAQLLSTLKRQEALVAQQEELLKEQISYSTALNRSVYYLGKDEEDPNLGDNERPLLEWDKHRTLIATGLFTVIMLTFFRFGFS